MINVPALTKAIQAGKRVAAKQAERIRPLEIPVDAGETLIGFTQYTYPGYDPQWFHYLVGDTLDAVERGHIQNAMFFMPPRHGKSELVSRRYPAYRLGKNPDLRVISTSYGARLARKMNRDVQRIIDSPRYGHVFPNTRLNSKNIRTVASGHYLRNADEFEIVGHDGGYVCAGVGGAITGMGFDLGIVDDPLKGRKEANSETVRNTTWDWFTNDFLTRAENASQVLTFTRWHEDDIAGRYLELLQSEGLLDNWRIIILPAIAEDPIADYDPREAGQALWPDKFGLENLLIFKKVIGLYGWNSLYQQRPSAPDGNIFKRGWFPIVEYSPMPAHRIRYWDKAGTEDGGAFTAGVRMAITATGLTYVEDVIYGQWSAMQRENVIKQTAELDDYTYRLHGGVTVYVEQEPGSGGLESAEATIRNLRGHTVYKDPPSTNKDARLEPFAAQAEAGNVFVVKGDWNKPWLDELCGLPFTSRRDMSDATSGAFNNLSKPSYYGMDEDYEKYTGIRPARQQMRP